MEVYISHAARISPDEVDRIVDKRMEEIINGRFVRDGRVMEPVILGPYADVEDRGDATDPKYNLLRAALMFQAASKEHTSLSSNG